MNSAGFPRASHFNFATGMLFLVALFFCYPLIFTDGIVGNYGDIYQYAAPFRHFSKLNFQSGHVPLWNPHIFAGTPFLASPQSALFYPLTIIFYFIPLHTAFNLFSILHLFINALGMFLFLRSLKRSSSASIAGSMAWAFSFFFLSKLAAGHVIHLSGYSWTPIILLFAVRSLKTPLEATRRNPFFWISFLCLLTASLFQFFSGHVQVWFHTTLLLSILWGWKIFQDPPEERVFHVQMAGTCLICFICLSLVQSLPLLTYTLHSIRFNTAEIFNQESVFNFASSYSMNWKDLLGLFIPDFNGSPIRNQDTYPLFPSVYFETNTLYFGWLPLLFAAGGSWILVKKKNFFLLILPFLFLLLALGKNSPLYLLIWDWFSFLRVPARFYFLVLLLLTMSTALFWDTSVKNRASPLKIVLLLIILGDLYINGKQFIWSENHLNQIGKSEVMGWLQSRKNVERAPFRIFSTSEIGNPNKTMFFNLSNVNGYEAILQKSLMRFFVSTQGENSVSTTGVDLLRPEKPSSFLLSAKYLVTTRDLDLKWPIRHRKNDLKVYENPVYFPPAQPIFSLKRMRDYSHLFAFLESGNFDREKEILKIGESGTSRFPEQEVELTLFNRPDPNRIEMGWKSFRDCSFWILLPEAYFPGWEGWTQSGKRLIPFQSNGYVQGALFTDFKAPFEKVFWIFRPKDYRYGTWGTIASLLVLISLLTLSIKSAISRIGKTDPRTAG